MPGGGGVRVADRQPVEVSDRGKWRLDELAILQEAGEAAGMRLRWTDPERHKRWRSNTWRKLLAPTDEWLWSVAEVRPDTCDICLENFGSAWTETPDGKLWVCEECHDGNELGSKSGRTQDGGA
ncbi:hypothetical protein ACLF3G_23455 [Falsiroseomonas sp. HC035]|uniref:hypothetical protein n=1 Tax=Falsiroseomonas sp. HC035 TaxID=3390999 RepID=UPI003D310479